MISSKFLFACIESSYLSRIYFVSLIKRLRYKRNGSYHHHHHHHHRLSVRFPLTTGVGRIPWMYSLHCARFCAISGFKFNSFMSSLTHPSHVFLGLPLQPFPSTLTFRQALPTPPLPYAPRLQTQSTSPYHLHHTLNIQAQAQVVT